MKRTVKTERKKYDFIHKSSIEYGSETFRYNHFKKDHPVFTDFGNHFLLDIKDSEKILDAGCGKGGFMRFFENTCKTPFSNFWGIDISKIALSFCPSDSHLFRGSITSLPYGNNFFDLVYFFDGMEHIPAEWEEKAFSELLRVAKNKLYLSIDTKSTKEDGRMKSLSKDIVHINLKTYEEWIDWIRSYENKLGFRLILNSRYKSTSMFEIGKKK